MSLMHVVDPLAKLDSVYLLEDSVCKHKSQTDLLVGFDKIATLRRPQVFCHQQRLYSN